MGGTTHSGRRRYLYNEIVEYIQEMIRGGEFRVGGRIPPERSLARRFGVSRNCIRQAIQALSEKGILESRRGAGTYVCAPGCRTVPIDSLTPPVEIQKDLVRDIIQFRIMLEPQIAALAATRITSEELDRLKIIVCDQDRRNLAGDDDSSLDAEFHLLLAKASRNRIVQRVVGMMNEIINESRSEPLQSEERRRASVIGHIRIIDAMEKGDPRMACQAMKDHLLSVERIVLGNQGEDVPQQETV
jgi:GntR family transcriptional repressor for pyruvate dehydrogenase complex